MSFETPGTTTGPGLPARRGTTPLPANVQPAAEVELRDADGEPRQTWGLIGEKVAWPPGTPSGLPLPAPPTPVPAPAPTAETAAAAAAAVAPTPDPALDQAPGEAAPADLAPPLRAFRRIEVPAPEKALEAGAGEGVGPMRTFTMLVGEAMSAYRSIRDAGRSLSAGELLDRLLDRFGIAADQAAVDGQSALVSRETGNVLALDADGDGLFGPDDMRYRDALLDAGIDPDWQPDQAIMDRPLEALEEMERAGDRRQEDERKRQERLELRQEFESPGPLPGRFKYDPEG